jgi:hypothetical protein
MEDLLDDGESQNSMINQDQLPNDRPLTDRSNLNLKQKFKKETNQRYFKREGGHGPNDKPQVKLEIDRKY